MDGLEAESRPNYTARANIFFDRIESIYLVVVRVTVLLFATLLILYTAYLVVSGLWNISRSPSSVVEAVANVSAPDIVEAEAADKLPNAGSAPAVNPAWSRFYADFAKRYYALFHARFEPYRQPDDKVLTRDEFDDAFIQSGARIQALTQGSLDFASDRADLEALLETMRAAADQPRARQRLSGYKAAKKVNVTHQVERTRTEIRQGWNSYSEACENWYVQPYGCSEPRAVQVPYTDTVTTKEFPKGTQSHSQIFHAMQDRFFSLLGDRRAANAAEAARKRALIIEGNYEGKESLGFALKVFAAFIVLMFFFLLIAIERHQRRLSASLPENLDAEPAPPLD